MLLPTFAVMESEVTGLVKQLFSKLSDEALARIEKLPQSGSDRIYFRLYSASQSLIATYNENKKENETFIRFSKHFNEKELPVPRIIGVSDDGLCYIQEDLGSSSLMNRLEQHGHSEEIYLLFKDSLKELARVQILGHEGMNYDWCLTAREFGKQAIMSDLLYFKYYFLDTLKLPYDKEGIMDDFESLSSYLTKTQYKYFMYRDFQSRNIIINHGAVKFIDYQGGMQGAMQYDVASLLWQAKAELSDDWKNSLLHYYINEVEVLLGKKIERSSFINQYHGYVLIRLIQVLGAYGFRGLFQRKAHFLSSIPLALRNLKWFVENKNVGIDLPVLNKVLQEIVIEERIQQFQPVQADDKTPLVVRVSSFSYKKGIPVDESENGGGFVFDCRGILNPGRYDDYKTFCGKDKCVIDFLEQNTRMTDFLNSVFDIVDIAVEDYIKRGFSNLMINFGCTGGQHRSVYAAEQTARHLKNKYKVKVVLEHTNQANWVKELTKR